MQHGKVGRLNVAEEVSGQRKHHGLHAGKGGDGKANQHGFTLAQGLRLHFLRVIRRGGVARFLNQRQDGGKLHARFIPAHACALCAVIQLHLVNARLAHQPLLNQPHAGGASDAAQHQRGFALVFRQRFHKFGLHFGQVVEFELRHDFIGRQLSFFGLGGAVFVVAA